MSRLLCQLSYTAVALPSPLTESNRRPSPYHGDALPTELRGPHAISRVCPVSVHGPSRRVKSTSPKETGLRNGPQPAHFAGRRGVGLGLGLQPSLEPLVGQRAAEQE